LSSVRFIDFRRADDLGVVLADWLQIHQHVVRTAVAAITIAVAVARALIVVVIVVVLRPIAALITEVASHRC
jgi:hypothetical protein